MRFVNFVSFIKIRHLISFTPLPGPRKKQTAVAHWKKRRKKTTKDSGDCDAMTFRNFLRTKVSCQYIACPFHYEYEGRVKGVRLTLPLHFLFLHSVSLPSIHPPCPLSCSPPPLKPSQKPKNHINRCYRARRDGPRSGSSRTAGDSIRGSSTRSPCRGSARFCRKGTVWFETVGVSRSVRK